VKAAHHFFITICAASGSGGMEVKMKIFNIKNKKINKLLAIVITIILLLTGCGVKGNDPKQSVSRTNENSKNDPIVLKIAMTLNDKSNFYIGAAEFKKRVEEKTQGKIKFEIYHSAVLGNDRDLVEGLTMGSVDMAIVGTVTLASFVPETQVFGMPFIFRDRDHVAKVLNGPIGEKVAKLFEPKGIKFMAYWENGFRHLTNSKKPVKTLDDLKGLKIRVVQNPLHVSFWKALGTDPTPITWAELFTALQQGTVDGQENPIALIRDAKLYEVQKYMTLTGHVYDPAAVMFSLNSLNKLSPDLQKIILETAKEVGPWQINYMIQNEGKILEELEKTGLVIQKEPEIEAFRKAVEGVYNEFQAKYPWAKELIDGIKQTK
jgi:tripartite ATP-independent transporter DctP family solute receptor